MSVPNQDDYLQLETSFLKKKRLLFVQSRLRSFLLSCFIFMVLLSATYGLWHSANKAAMSELQAHFDFRVRDTISLIEQRMSTYEQVLRGVQGLLSASQMVERDEFKQYVAALKLDENYPGIHGVGIATIVPYAEKSEHVRQIRSQGYPGYDIKPAGKRAVYVPITHMEPFTGANLKAFGFDIYSKPEPYPAMDKARDLGIAIISGKIKLVQDADNVAEVPAFVMYLPFYEKGATVNTVAQRRAHTLGWVDAPFRMADLMDGLGGERASDLAVQIYDGDEVSKKTKMYESVDISKEMLKHSPLFKAIRQMEVVGHHWTLVVQSLPLFEAQLDTEKAHFIAFTGTTLSFLLAWLTWLLTTGRSRAIVVANAMTRELRESEERWKFALEGSGDGVWDWDIKTGHVFLSKRWNQILGFDDVDTEKYFEQWKLLIHEADFKETMAVLQAHLNKQTPTYFHEHRVRCQDGSLKWILSRGMVISRDVHGQPIRMLGTYTDISTRKMAEAQISQLAHYDVLTNLPNRALLLDRLEHEIKKTKRTGAPLGLMFTDIDHFKEVNDTLGHHIGDLLLKEAAQRLLSCVRETDTVARFGGDEFTIILGELDDMGSVDRIAKDILHKLSQPFELDCEVIYVSVSIGITLYPHDAIGAEGLLQNADQAMYSAKSQGRNRYNYFTRSMQEAAQTRMRLANDLRTAVSNDQLFVVYQPIIDLATGLVHKAEALVRWQHPTRGLVSPVEFIPIAEETGLIIDVGNFVFEQAAMTVKRWRESHHPHFQISVNNSPVQLYQANESNIDWFSTLKALGLSGQSISIEITESLLMDASDIVREKLLAFHDVGMQVSLDDFGTGYSSLSYLKKFDIDYLKIDQSFVRNLTSNSEDHVLCEAIIVMAHKLNIKVIAEGVETAEQRDLLFAAGCDYAQGYLFAKPLTVKDFETFITLA